MEQQLADNVSVLAVWMANLPKRWANIRIFMNTKS